MENTLAWDDWDLKGVSIVMIVAESTHSQMISTVSRLAATLAKPMFRLTPFPLQRFAVELAINQAFARPIQDGRLEFLHNRVVMIDIPDLGYCWLISLRDGRLRLLDPGCQADVTIRGESEYFVALCLRQEDPDTFFFRRRLSIRGDTELGVALKNFLDSIEHADLPPVLRQMPDGLRSLLLRLVSQTKYSYATQVRQDSPVSASTHIATVDRLRVEIDKLDAMLIHLLGERHRVVEAIQAVKQVAGMPSICVPREHQMLAKWKQQGVETGLDPDRVERVFNVVLRNRLTSSPS